MQLQVGDIKPTKFHIPKEIPQYPQYPYGESHIYKQSNRGLYGGQFIGSGNKVSENGHKTPRKFKVNVIRKTFWSQIMGQKIKLKTSARVLRTMKKEGGFDNYLLKEKSARIKELGPKGYQLKYDLLMAQQRKLAAQKPLHTLKDRHGVDRKVYHIATVEDKKYKFRVGKKKILRYLYKYLQLDRIEPYSWKDFNTEHQPKSVEELTKILLEKRINMNALIL